MNITLDRMLDIYSLVLKHGWGIEYIADLCFQAEEGILISLNPNTPHFAPYIIRLVSKQSLKTRAKSVLERMVGV